MSLRRRIYFPALLISEKIIKIDLLVLHYYLYRIWNGTWKYLCCCSCAELCLTLCDPVDCSMPGFPVHHQLPEFAQTHVHRVSDAIQQSHPLSSLSLPAFSLSLYQGLFQWLSSLHQVTKVLELQLQHQSFQWIFRLIFFPWLNNISLRGWITFLFFHS